MSSWCELPDDLLERILTRVSSRDRFKAATACTSWWSVMIRRWPRPPPLLLVNHSFFHLPKSAATVFARSFSKLPLRARFCGSSAGWLVYYADETSRLHLLNPISGEPIDFPFVHRNRNYSNFRIALSSSPKSGNCIFAVEGDMLQLNKFGSRNWTLLEVPSRVFTIYKKKLYVLGIYGRITYVYDFEHELRLVSMVEFDVSRIYSLASPAMQLVVMDGRIVMVVRYRDRRAWNHRVFRLNDDDAWTEIHSLGDWMLLWDSFCAKAFPTRMIEGSGFRGNCIYYRGKETDVVVCEHSMELGDIKCISIPCMCPTVMDWFMPEWQ